MTVVTIDSTDTAAILADAGVEIEQPETHEEEPAKQEAKPADKGVAGEEDPDDIEGEDGLTPRQKREFTQTMQKTIGKKHRQMKEAEEFAADQYNSRRLAEQRAEQLERELAELRSKSSPKEAPKAPEKPDRKNFATEGEYVDAMIQYGVDQRLREKAEEDAKARAEREKAERVEKIIARLDRARELVPDWQEVAEAADTPVPPGIAGYMEKSELVAELAYHFAKNPDVLLSLAKLPPDEQLVKIGRIESTLSPFEPKGKSDSGSKDDKSSKETNGQAKPAPSEDTESTPSKPRGKAAPVITPLDGTGSAGIHKDSKDMNIREAIEDFSKRNRVNLGVRKRH